MTRGKCGAGALAAFLAVAVALSSPSVVAAGEGTESAPLAEQALAAMAQAQDATSPAERKAGFARAERLFAAAAEAAPGSVELWVNAGTAALQAEHPGAAVAAYRRALVLDPDHRRARQNLVHARTLLPAWVPRPEDTGFLGSALAWQSALSDDEKRGAAALAFAVACAFVAASIVTGSAAARLFALLPLAAWALLAAPSLIDASSRPGVLGSDAPAHAADSRNAPARFAEPLPAGTEVEIAEVRGEWTRVVLADGRDAWVGTAGVLDVGGGR